MNREIKNGEFWERTFPTIREQYCSRKIDHPLTRTVNKSDLRKSNYVEFYASKRKNDTRKHYIKYFIGYYKTESFKL